LDDVRLVAMTAEDNTGMSISQPFLDDGRWCPDKPAL
jgi:hypothetical protein